MKVYVPRDAAARSLGADAVAQAVLHEAEKSGFSVELVRNGSRGMLWLEPLVEVETAAGRIAYGPVQAGDVAALVAAGMLDGAPTQGCHGRTDDIDWLASQHRVTFRRVGVTDPLDIADYRAHGLDERIEVKRLYEGREFLYQLVKRLAQ